MWRAGADSLADVEAWVERRTTDPQGRFFLIEHQGEPVGFCQLTRIDLADLHCHLGLFVEEAIRGQGVAAVALRLIELEAAALGIRKVILEVLSSNLRAIRFWEKSSYRVVGCLKSHHRHEDVFHDVTLLEKALAPSGNA
jgi:RimJ/RimL family protein N-acetyltransferase